MEGERDGGRERVRKEREGRDRMHTIDMKDDSLRVGERKRERERENERKKEIKGERV